MSAQSTTSNAEKLWQGNKKRLLKDTTSWQSLRDARWSTNGQRIACIHTNHTRIWLVDKPEIRNSIELKTDSSVFGRPPVGVSWDPIVQDALVILGGDGTVREYDLKTKSNTQKIKLGPAFAIAHAYDGTKIAVALLNSSIVLLDRDFNEISVYQEPNEEIYGIAWSNNSQYLAISLFNGSIRIIQMGCDTPPKVVKTLRGHRTAAKCLEFDPSGRYLAVGTNEGVVSLWDLETLICTGTIDVKSNQAVSAISFSHDGLMLAIATIANVIEIAKVPTGEHVFEIKRNVYCESLSVHWHPLIYRLTATGDREGLAVYTL